MTSSSAYEAAPWVLTLAPDPRDPGGVTRMLDRWFAAGLAERVTFTRIVNTRWDASPSTKAFLAIGAYLRLLRCGLRRGSSARPDVVHLHISVRAGLYRELVAAELARLCGLPVIAHIHSGQFFDWVRVSRVASFCARRLLSNASVVVVLADVWSEEARRFGAVRTAVVPHFVPPELGAVLGGAGRVRSPERDSVVNLLYYGRWSAVKGIDVVASALALLDRKMQSRIRLRVFGNGDRAWVARCFAKVPAVAVDVLGWLGDESKPAELALAHAMLVPSRSEGFNQALLEAIAARTPVVASAVGPVEDILRGYPLARLVPPDDPAALRDVIVDMLDNRWPPADRPASERILARFEPSQILDGLAALYREVARS